MTPVVNVQGFAGIHSMDLLTAGGTEHEPPDQALAVNNNVAVEITNRVLRFFDATTGAPLSPAVSLQNVFGQADDYSAPQAFFDPATGRWFLTAASRTIVCVARFFCFTSSTVGIAVSETGDPLGSYFVYLIGGSGIYVRAGYDANGLYISYNLSPRADSRILAFSKSKLAAGEPFFLRAVGRSRGLRHRAGRSGAG
jgi:hypothetical protein